MSRCDLIDIAVTVLAETERAWKIDHGSLVTGPCWVPKSLCEFNSSQTDARNGVLTCPEWLAKEKGMI